MHQRTVWRSTKSPCTNSTPAVFHNGGATVKSLERMEDKINLATKLAAFSDYWSPHTIAQLNDSDVMVVKVKGEFVWHKHDETVCAR